jgi:hypothetical protein
MIDVPFHRQVLGANYSGLLVGGRFSGAARHLLLMCVSDNEKINVANYIITGTLIICLNRIYNKIHGGASSWLNI